MPGRTPRLLLVLAAALAMLASMTTAAGAAIGLGQAKSLEPATAHQATAPDECREAIGLGAPQAAQEQAMLCLVNETRDKYGLPVLTGSEPLRRSAIDKGRDLIDCNEFSHTACGREFSYWIRETGYLSNDCWRTGENLAWGVEEQGTVDDILRAWMRSPTHRENILGDFAEIGLDLRLGALGGLTGVHIWVQHFGSRCV